MDGLQTSSKELSFVSTQDRMGTVIIIHPVWVSKSWWTKLVEKREAYMALPISSAIFSSQPHNKAGDGPTIGVEEALQRIRTMRARQTHEVGEQHQLHKSQKEESIQILRDKTRTLVKSLEVYGSRMRRGSTSTGKSGGANQSNSARASTTSDGGFLHEVYVGAKV